MNPRMIRDAPRSRDVGGLAAETYSLTSLERR